MAISLDHLSDDQLLGLWQAVVSEIGTRLYSTSELALEIVEKQREIDKERVKRAKETIVLLEAEYASWKPEIVSQVAQNMKFQLRDEIKKRARDEFREAIRDGSARLVDLDEETGVIVEATLAAKLKLLDEVIAEVAAAEPPQDETPRIRSPLWSDPAGAFR